ncbi:MAG TPA: hypothetical protein P5081_08830 [Phycisphaerae bacterium]|nr:hypothetical protein [Phycisphaerae bacterium]HRW52979.1 hypothetical protein [Phycisphaerae bacterium]
MKRRRIHYIALLAMTLAPAALTAQYEVTSHTVDCGGGQSVGGSFELEGAIGQHDAGPAEGMTGGGYALAGGFWGPSTVNCACLGDMNGDGARNASDIQQFVDCILNGGACSCADVNGISGIGEDDIPAFVASLLAGDACP